MVRFSGGWRALLLLVAWTGALHAGEVEELARIHTEAIGGRARLDRIEALEARGRVAAGGRTLDFELVAQRPNRVRVSMADKGRTLVQIADGSGAAWRMDADSATGALRSTPMSPAEAQAFTADAEFDDPLASAPDRGYRLDAAGEIEWNGRRVRRVLVTRSDMRPVHLLVDPDTYFIVARIARRQLASGREVVEETIYDAFRMVAGVIFPHRVETRVDGQLVRETVLLEVQPIPAPADDTFSPPAASEVTLR